MRRSLSGPFPIPSYHRARCKWSNGPTHVVGRSTSPNRFDTVSPHDRNPDLTLSEHTGVMVIIRWIFVLGIVALILAGVALIDGADRSVRRRAGRGEPLRVDQARSLKPRARSV